MAPLSSCSYTLAEIIPPVKGKNIFFSYTFLPETLNLSYGGQKMRKKILGVICLAVFFSFGFGRILLTAHK